MKNKLTISVVVPAFNEEKYLSRCLASLKKQTYKPLEVIVVDNNSTDKTAQIAKNFGAKVVFEKKQGVAYARDAGFKAARGEIIARTDADSLTPPYWLANIARNFKNPEVAGVTGSVIFYDLCSFLNFLSKYSYLFVLYFVRILAGHYHFMGPNMAVRKKVGGKISDHLNNPFFLEDVSLSCCISAFGKILFDPSLLVLISSRRFRKNIFDPTFGYAVKGLYTLFYHGHPFVRNHRPLSTPGVD